MPALKIAHLREQGQDMILVPLDHTFGYRTQTEQSEIVAEFQARAGAAGLRGRVAVMWEAGSTTMFIGPTPWHPYLQSISLWFIHANVNKQITW